MSQAHRLLVIPGPTNVPPQVAAATAAPMIGHRSDDFHQMYHEVETDLQKVMCTQSEVFIFTASGTGGLEAAVANFICPGDEVLSVSCGVFGDRFGQIAAVFGGQVHTVSFPHGQACDPDVVGETVAQHPEVTTVLLTHNETSTGVLNDVRILAEAVKRVAPDALILLDSVSGLVAHLLPCDEWGIDVLITASQKGLMTPPGLALIAVNPRAEERLQTCSCPRFYWDMRYMRKYFDRHEVPYTPAVSLVAGLRMALRMILEEGLDKAAARHARLRDAARAAMRALGFELLVADDCASSALTAVKVPEGLDEPQMRKRLYHNYSVELAGGMSTMAGKVFRLAHLGYFFDRDLLTALGCLESVLVEMDWSFKRGAGVAAAEEVFRASGK